MAEIITVVDLPAGVRSAEMVDMMVAGANANASRVAPCLASTDPAPSEDQLAEARLVLVGAVQRWADAGAGALSQMSAGPFQQTLDTRQRTGFKLWPSEIQQLRDICKSEQENRAHSVIPIGPTSLALHTPYCDLHFGGDTCSCGVALAGYPIYELG